MDGAETQLPQLFTVNELRIMLPPALVSADTKYAVYKDQNTKEHRVKITVSPEIQQIGHQNGRYDIEVHRIKFEDVKNDVLISFNLGGNVDDVDIRLKAQSIIIGYLRSPSPFGITIYYDYTTKAISKLSSPKINNLPLHGKNFKNVFYSDHKNAVGYEHLRFSFEYGIVSYSDKSGNVYVFDRFE